MTRYLLRIVLIGCVQTILVTSVALATDHKIAEIIRNKVEQIRTTQMLKIEDVQIASITVLPKLYENNGFRRLWTNSRNVEDLFNEIEFEYGRVEPANLDPRYVQLFLLE